MPIYVCKLVGRGTVASFTAALHEATVGPEPRYLMVDTLEMTAYDGEVRSWFIDEWAKKYPIRAIGGVSEKMLWRMVGFAVGMAVGVPTNIFLRSEEAHHWLEKLIERDRSRAAR